LNKIELDNKQQPAKHVYPTRSNECAPVNIFRFIIDGE